MDAVLRAAAIYFILMLVFRLAGRRSIAQITTFDFVLLLIIGEATQQALLSDDFSTTNAATVILVLITIDVLLTFGKRHSTLFGKVIEGTPIILVEQGQPVREHMKMVRVDAEDILESARQLQGLERMEQIKYAVMERNGQISIIPQQQ